LPLWPALSEGLIASEDIIIFATSGISGAGKGLKEGSLFCEVTGNTYAYGLTHHRHGPEIEQGLSWAAKKPVHISFTPNIVPLSRGMSLMASAPLAPKVSLAQVRACLEGFYASSPFVHVLPKHLVPQTKFVLGTNFAHIQVAQDRIDGRILFLCVIDNIAKGASSQAIQGMNLAFGLDETLGLNRQWAVTP
jgi:N-acetyl-gamma-glutamyl-phosphate reductase